jgi:hypothetical protein
MKLILKTLQAGPEGVKRPGDIIEVETKVARQYIDGGYAEPMDPVKPEPEAPKPTPPPLIDQYGEPADGLNAMKMPELKTMAKELGIPQKVGMTKLDLISAIRQAVATA